jgi:hypothetical protein
MVAQMAVVEQTFFETQKMLQKSKDDPALRNDAQVAMNKFARTYIMQMDALKRYRSKGEQKVTVQHVTVSDGGQAIVGDVHQQAKAAGAAASQLPPALSYSNERSMEPIGQSARQPVAVKSKASK